MRRTRVGAAILLTGSLLFGLAPAGVGAPQRVHSDSNAPREQLLRYLDAPGPLPPLNSSMVRLSRLRESLGGEQRFAALREAMQQEVETFEYSFLGAVHDITGDGRADAMVIHGKETYTIDQDEGGVPTITMDGKVTFSARAGRTGRELWSVTEKSTDGYTWIIEGDVGRKAKPGFVIVKDQGWSSNAPWVQLIAISGRKAKPIWRTRLDSTHVDRSAYVGDAGITRDEPWIMGVGNFAPGRPTDLLVALVTHSTLDYYSIHYDTGVTVIDGSRGKRTDHPDRERTVGWLPLPWPVGDQDLDGQRDYVFGNNIGAVVEEDPEPGAPELPLKLGGVLRARKGSTGEEIWAIGGLDLGQLALSYSVGDQFDDRRPELFTIVFDYEVTVVELPIPIPIPVPIAIEDLSNFRTLSYVMDGGGEVRFSKPIWLIHAPGKIDGDDQGDFLGWRIPWTRDTTTVKLYAFNSYGKQLWLRKLRSRQPDSVCKNVCGGFTFIGVGPAGDLQPDGGKDLMFYVTSETGEARTSHHYTVDGLTGRRLHQGGEELFSAGGSLDGHGWDLLEVYPKQGSSEMKARDGTDGSTLGSFAFDSGLPAARKDEIVWDDADVSGDGCTDLLFTIHSTGGAYAVVIDGGSGKPLWSEVIEGPDREIGIASGRDRNQRC